MVLPTVLYLEKILDSMKIYLSIYIIYVIVVCVCMHRCQPYSYGQSYDTFFVSQLFILKNANEYSMHALCL